MAPRSPGRLSDKEGWDLRFPKGLILHSSPVRRAPRASLRAFSPRAAREELRSRLSAEDLAELEDALAREDEQDPLRIERLRRLIEQGRYRVPITDLSCCILRAQLGPLLLEALRGGDS